MTELPPGLYEQLVTSGLDQRLRLLDPASVERGPLDPAEAHEVIARHLGSLARRALRSVSGDDATSVLSSAASRQMRGSQGAFAQVSAPQAV